MQIQFPLYSEHHGSVTNNQPGHAVYCENDTEHVNTLRERNVMLHQVVYIVTTGLKQRALHAFVNGSSCTPKTSMWTAPSVFFGYCPLSALQIDSCSMP